MRLNLCSISLACALACTVDNPAFLTATAADTTGATSGASSSASTGGGGSTVGPTTSATTSAPTTGTVGTSDVTNGVTDGNTTPPDSTTTSAGTGTTDAVSTSEPASSTGGGLDMGGLMMCAIEDAGHDHVPFLRPIDPSKAEPISSPVCSQYAGMELKGKLAILSDGFSVNADPNCGSLMGQPSFKFPLPWMLDANTVGGTGACVVFSYASHPEYLDQCSVAAIVVFKGPTPIIAGRFGTTETMIPIPNIAVSAVPKGLCVCPGCCPEAPDPDTYLFQIGGMSVPQGSAPVTLLPVNGKHFFVNFRSDIHPECSQEPLKPDWLHFDWIVVRAAG